MYCHILATETSNLHVKMACGKRYCFFQTNIEKSYIRCSNPSTKKE